MCSRTFLGFALLVAAITHIGRYSLLTRDKCELFIALLVCVKLKSLMLFIIRPLLLLIIVQLDNQPRDRLLCHLEIYTS